MVGSMGLATAGALPDTAQDAAHTVLDKVGVNVPAGHERYNDPGVCPGGPYKNHGAYVRAHKDDPNAGTSPCGKPLNAVNHPSGANGNGRSVLVRHVQAGLVGNVLEDERTLDVQLSFHSDFRYPSPGCAEPALSHNVNVSPGWIACTSTPLAWRFSSSGVPGSSGNVP